MTIDEARRAAEREERIRETLRRMERESVQLMLRGWNR